MAIIIDDTCIVCHACVAECPNHAIYAEGEQWRYIDGPDNKTLFSSFPEGVVTFPDGTSVDIHTFNAPLNKEIYFIVPNKCTECAEYHEVPSCNEVCPVECCVPDPDRSESVETLLAKKELMHG